LKRLTARAVGALDLKPELSQQIDRPVVRLHGAAFELQPVACA
jgi:hypothetical protein